MADRKDERTRVIDVAGVDLLTIDKAVYEWFNVKHPTKIKGRQVPVIFGAWERFAQMHETRDDNNLNSLRDNKGMLRLPIISIKRGDISSNEQMYKKITTRGEPTVTVVKKIANASFDKTRKIPYNYYGENKKNDNPVFEIHKIPFPEYINIPYTITFWSSYIKHANSFNNMLWPLHDFPDLNYNGYYFHAQITGSSNESNVETFSDEERIIRNSFEMMVNGYIFDQSQIIIERTSTKIILNTKASDALEYARDEESFDDFVDRYNK